MTAEADLAAAESWSPENRKAMLDYWSADAKREVIKNAYADAAELAVALDPKYVVTDALKLIAANIETALRRPRHNLLITMSPQEGKSYLCSVMTPLRALQLNPHCRIILTTYADALAAEHSQVCRNLINAHGSSVIDQLTGTVMEDKLGYRLAAGQNKIGTWKIAGARGGMIAVGLGSSITGRRADVLIIDDPLKNMMEADSANHRRKIVDWFNSVAQTRLSPDASMILIQTRWHMDDLAGMIIAEQAAASTQFKSWKLLNIPAISEESIPDALGRPPGEPMESARGRTRRDWERTRQAVGERVWYCTPAETPILMADFTEKPISEVTPGDEVMGFAKGGVDDDGRKYPLRFAPAKVLHAGQVGVARVNDILMESGNRVRCTADHRWWVGRHGTERRAGRIYERAEYRPAAVGSQLQRLDADLPILTPERQRLLDYFAGMIDGEGSIGTSSLVIAQSPDANPEVYARIGEVLDKLGYSYNLRASTPPSFKRHWGRQGNYVLRNIRAVYTEVLRRTDCAKGPRMLQNMLSRPSYPRKYQDRVLRIDPGPIEPVYALETETGNYVAWGYGSSNSMYQGSPRNPAGGLFARGWFDPHADTPADPVATIIGIDPADTGDGDATGIIAAALAQDGRVILTEDWSGQFTSEQWSRRAVMLALQLGAREIAMEAYSTATTYEQVLKRAYRAMHADALTKHRAGVELSAIEMRALSEQPPFTIYKWRAGARVDAIGRSSLLRQALETHRCRTVEDKLAVFEDQSCDWQVGQHQPDRVAAAIIAHDRLAALAGGRMTVATPVDRRPDPIGKLRPDYVPSRLARRLGR